MRGQQLTNPPDYLWRDKWTALKWTTLSSCPTALGGCPGLTGIETKVQGFFAHKKQHPPLGPPWDPRYGPALGS